MNHVQNLVGSTLSFCPSFIGSTIKGKKSQGHLILMRFKVSLKRLFPFPVLAPKPSLFWRRFPLWASFSGCPPLPHALPPASCCVCRPHAPPAQPQRKEAAATLKPRGPQQVFHNLAARMPVSGLGQHQAKALGGGAETEGGDSDRCCQPTSASRREMLGCHFWKPQSIWGAQNRCQQPRSALCHPGGFSGAFFLKKAFQ